MTNKDKTGTARQQARRMREREWLAAHGFTSWEQLHTKLMNGDIWLDRVTPAYSQPKFNKVDKRLQKELSQLADAIVNNPLGIISKKKGKQS